MFTFVSKEDLEYLYPRIATFIPFDDPKDTRTDSSGIRLRDKTYLICGGDFGAEKFLYTDVGEDIYKQIGSIEYDREAHNGKPCMKIWYLHVMDDYQRLGLATMLIASVKNECQEKGITTLTLDAARRYKRKDDHYKRSYPNAEDDGKTFYNANLKFYESLGFKIDREHKSYRENMEENFMDNMPIPMVCELDGIVCPESAKALKNEASAIDVAIESSAKSSSHAPEGPCQ